MSTVAQPRSAALHDVVAEDHPLQSLLDSYLRTARQHRNVIASLEAKLLDGHWQSLVDAGQAQPMGEFHDNFTPEDWIRMEEKKARSEINTRATALLSIDRWVTALKQAIDGSTLEEAKFAVEHPVAAVAKALRSIAPSDIRAASFDDRAEFVCQLARLLPHVVQEPR